MPCRHLHNRVSSSQVIISLTDQPLEVVLSPLPAYQTTECADRAASFNVNAVVPQGQGYVLSRAALNFARHAV